MIRGAKPGDRVLVSEISYRRQHVSDGVIIAEWDLTISRLGTVVEVLRIHNNVWVSVEPDPDAGFGQFMFLPRDLTRVKKG